MRIYPGEYIVWDLKALDLTYNILKEGLYNPHYWDIKEIEDSNEWLARVFNTSNTDSIFYIEYYGEPAYEISVVIAKIKGRKNYSSIKAKIKEEDFRRVKNSFGFKCRQVFLFDDENSVILNLGSVDDKDAYKKIDELTSIILKELPDLEVFGD